MDSLPYSCGWPDVWLWEREVEKGRFALFGACGGGRTDSPSGPLPCSLLAPVVLGSRWRATGISASSTVAVGFPGDIHWRLDQHCLCVHASRTRVSSWEDGLSHCTVSRPGEESVWGSCPLSGKPLPLWVLHVGASTCPVDSPHGGGGGGTWEEGLRPTIPWNCLTQGTRIDAKQSGSNIAAPPPSMSIPVVHNGTGQICKSPAWADFHQALWCLKILVPVLYLWHP